MGHPYRIKEIDTPRFGGGSFHFYFCPWTMSPYRISSGRSEATRSLRAISFGFVVFCLAVANSFAAAELPIPRHLLKRRFPQHDVGDCSIPLPSTPSTETPAARTLHAGGITIRNGTRSALQVEGADQRGNLWQIVLMNQPGGCSAWHADLDHNGREDLIIATFNPASGGKDVVLTIVMIDDSGRPVPWSATGYFDVDDQGVRDLLDLDQDGRAELAFLYMEGDRFERQRSSLSLYQARQAHWQRVSGNFAGLTFPIIRPPRVKLAKTSDLSTIIDERTVPLLITSLVPGTKQNCGVQLPLGRQPSGSVRIDEQAAKALGKTCYDQMVLSDGRRVRLPEMAVIDRPLTREVLFESTSRLIAEAKDRGYSVQIVGHSCESECRPFLLWGTETIKK